MWKISRNFQWEIFEQEDDDDADELDMTLDDVDDGGGSSVHYYYVIVSYASEQYLVKSVFMFLRLSGSALSPFKHIAG